MNLDATTEGDIVRSIPSLRAFAVALCRNRDRADDLVQETLTSALAHIDSFEKGTNLSAWLVTILRNNFYSQYRKPQMFESDGAGRLTGSLAVLPDQIGWGIAHDLRAGLTRLSSIHRQALYLVGACGLSYGEAAVIAGCEVGTMKSRVSRARSMLARFMSGEAERRPNTVLGPTLKSGQGETIAAVREPVLRPSRLPI